ncbi:claudin-15-like isoform X2 [Spea bombifrons]|uniref:claudin-15-like isoform X2 n=1 Tax=Spea bombifrons TaxID=233779 RepID=UPI0023499E6B|nr:claudin-15-like isoform X2 [Spea bombifrons]
MSAALQIVGFLMSLAGSLVTGVTLASNRWKTSTLRGSVITTSTLYENLWKSCAEDSTGISNCKRFDSLLSLPAYVQVCRALMIISIILGLISCVVSMFGLKCTKFGSSNEYTKGKIALGGGLLFILAGLCCLIAVSWYAAMVTAQFFDPLYGGTKYELGSALYIGWAGSLLAILGGSFLCCSFKKKKKNRPGGYKYNQSAAPDNDFKQFKERKESSMASRAYV